MIPAIVHSAREQWLLRRRELVTASDAAAILGRDPRRGALAVYVDKVTESESVEQPWMRRGRRWEPIIADEYAEKTGRRVIDVTPYEIVIHPDVRIIGASLDRRTEIDGQTVPLELKRVGRAHAREWDDGDTPVYYDIQVQIQAACEGATLSSICALTSLDDEPEVRDIPRHDRFLAVAIPKLEEFWWRVQRREPPTTIDAMPATTAALKALYGEEDGETVVLPADAVDLADAWEAACLRRKDAEREADLYENHIRRLIGEASFGDLADGSYLSLAVTNVKGYTKTVPPSSYRRIRRVRPRLPRRTR